MLKLNDFRTVKILACNMIKGGYVVTGAGSRSGVSGGKSYCFTYTSDCSITDGDETSTRFCGIVFC